jgi:hypothetical protein
MITSFRDGMLPPLCKRFMTRLNTCAPTLLPHPPHLWSKKQQQTPTNKQRTTNDKSKIWKPSIENKSVPPTNNNPTQPISHPHHQPHSPHRHVRQRVQGISSSRLGHFDFVRRRHRVPFHVFRHVWQIHRVPIHPSAVNVVCGA